MATDLEDRMLQLLDVSATSSQITISDFARTFGANRDLIARCAQRLVDSGAAIGTHVERNGHSRLHALRAARSGNAESGLAK